MLLAGVASKAVAAPPCYCASSRCTQPTSTSRPPQTFFDPAAAGRGRVPKIVIAGTHAVYRRALHRRAWRATHIQTGLRRARGEPTKAVSKPSAGRARTALSVGAATTTPARSSYAASSESPAGAQQALLHYEVMDRPERQRALATDGGGEVA
jgi:hypothetical protein